MSEWGISQVMFATPEQLADMEFLTECDAIYYNAKSKRSDVIEALLCVEGLLDLVLLDLLVGPDPLPRERVREQILYAEFCTTFQKWKMLGQLMSAAPEYFETLAEEERKRLRTQIKELNEHRNKFAHGDLFIDARDVSAMLRHYNNGTKFLTVTDAFISTVLADARWSRQTLLDLRRRFDLATIGTAAPPGRVVSG